MSNSVQRNELFLKLKYFRVIIFNGYFPFSIKFCVYAAAIGHGIGIHILDKEMRDFYLPFKFVVGTSLFVEFC